MAKPTVSVAQKAAPREKPYKLSDQRGLYRHVMPNGGRHWRMKDRLQGREKVFAIGSYPDMKLSEARDACDDARRQIRAGIDPVQARKAVRDAQRGADRFESTAGEWFGSRRPTWAKGHADRVIRLLERDVFPYIGRGPATAMAAPKVLDLVRRRLSGPEAPPIESALEVPACGPWACSESRIAT
jgi:hypothetical protein